MLKKFKKLRPLMFILIGLAIVSTMVYYGASYFKHSELFFGIDDGWILLLLSIGVTITVIAGICMLVKINKLEICILGLNKGYKSIADDIANLKEDINSTIEEMIDIEDNLTDQNRLTQRMLLERMESVKTTLGEIHQAIKRGNDEKDD